MAKDVKGHAYARGVLTVTYIDDTVETFNGVTDAQHGAFVYTRGLNDEGEDEIHELTPTEQGAFLDTIRK